MHGFNMLFQIINAIIIDNAAIIFKPIISTQTIFNHHQRDLIAIINFIESNSKTCRVNLPTPITRLQIRVFSAAHEIPTTFGSDICRLTKGHIVAKGIEIHLARCQNRIVSWRFVNLNPMFSKVTLGKSRITATHLHITTEIVGKLHDLLIFQDICWVRR